MAIEIWDDYITSDEPLTGEDFAAIDASLAATGGNADDAALLYNMLEDPPTT